VLVDGEHVHKGKRMSGAAIARHEAPREWGMDWEQRLLLATPEDTTLGLFLSGTLEAIRSLGGEALARRCLSACGVEGFEDFRHYPVRLHLRLVSTALRGLEAWSEGQQGMMWQLGRRAAAHFLESSAGRTMRRLVRDEPKRLVSHLPAAYRVPVSFGERAVVWTGPQSAQLVVKGDFLPPPFHEGVLVAMLERLNARTVRVRGRQTGVLDSEYELSWQ
jgi:uncharacterized protein (TIGR02265 family)